MRYKWLSFIALVLSLIAVIFALVRVVPAAEVSEQSYIGILATLIGICATFLVSYKIYNTVETREKLKQLKELSEELNATKETLLTLEHDLKMRHADISCDTFYQKGKYLYAFNSGILCFYHAMKVNSVDEIESMILNLPLAIEHIDGLDHEYLKEIESNIELIGEDLEDNEVFMHYRRQFEAIVRQYREKIEKLERSLLLDAHLSKK